MFNKRWESVIAPAIQSVEKNDVSLEPYRVDISRVSDSILTEILTDISRSLVIFADVTSLGKIENKPIRNGNVMYEVGFNSQSNFAQNFKSFYGVNPSIYIKNLERK